MTETTHSKGGIPLNIQLFANGDSGDSGGSGTESAEVENTNTSTDTETKPADSEKESKNADNKPNDSDKLDKIIQSRVDRAMADERKKNADLLKELEKLKREKLSDDEIKQLEVEEREKAIADKEKALTEKENRLFAIKAIKEAGLDDGSDKVLELVDLVVSGTNDTEETIQNKVKSFSDLLKSMVAAEVEKTFKANGRIPNGASSAGDTKDTSNIAVKLGKERAEANKKANDVLSYYTGGKK